MHGRKNIRKGYTTSLHVEFPEGNAFRYVPTTTEFTHGEMKASGEGNMINISSHFHI